MYGDGDFAEQAWGLRNLSKRRIRHEPGVEFEPHLQRGDDAVAAREADADEIGMEPVRALDSIGTGFAEAEDHLHALGDEPALSGEVLANVDALGYGDYVALRTSETKWWMRYGGVILAAVVSGPFAILGVVLSAFMGSGHSWIAFASLCLFGPLVEEMLKLGGALYLTEQRPWLLPGAWCVPVIAVISALEFAVIENLLYLYVYFPNAGADLVVWRWTVCVAWHVGCSLIGSVGIMLVARRARQTGKPPRISIATPYFIVAVLIHGSYNGLMYFLEVSGIVF